MTTTGLSKNPHFELVSSVRQAFTSGKTKPLEYRLEQLKNLELMVQQNRDVLIDAISKDLRKPKHESTLYEVDFVLSEINNHKKNLAKWSQDDKLPVNLLAFMDTAYVRKEPYGVVLILGAWNYPIMLTLQPAVGAISAGNCVVIKPSELSPVTARVVADLIPKYLDPECYRVVLAEVEGTKQLLANNWDYIFCTGSPSVGRAVMAAAAPNLTPVTLELGGKTPCYIDNSADFEIAANRILWGKCVNLGQTCIAPDYVLCSPQAQAAFINVAKAVLKRWYGDDLQGNPDIARIINERHWKRLCYLLDTTKGKIVHGGVGRNLADLWIEPTLVINVPDDDPLMQEEIFGPILPIINVNSAVEAIDYINRRPKPLALYTFAKNEAVNKQLVSDTSSGGVCVNDCIWHSGWNGLPFGGVGPSGMGSYHGKFSFDTFSHHKSVLERSFSLLSEKLGQARYPPYTAENLKLFQTVLKYLDYFNFTGGAYVINLLAMMLGAALYALVNWMR